MDLKIIFRFLLFVLFFKNFASFQEMRAKQKIEDEKQTELLEIKSIEIEEVWRPSDEGESHTNTEIEKKENCKDYNDHADGRCPEKVDRQKKWKEKLEGNPSETLVNFEGDNESVSRELKNSWFIISNQSSSGMTFVHDVGELISDLSRHFKMPDIEVCISSTDIDDNLAKKLSLYLSSQPLSIRKCQDEVDNDIENDTKLPMECLSRTEGATPRCHKRIRVWIAMSKEVGMVEKEVKGHLMRSLAKIYHVIITDIFKEHLVSEDPPGSALWFYCVYNQNNRTVDISEVYNFLGSSLALQVPMGKWTFEHRMLNVDPLGIGPRNFQGRTLVVASIVFPPYLLSRKSCEINIFNKKRCFANFQQPKKRQLNGEKYTGYSVDIVDIMAEQLNFTYIIKFPPPDEYYAGVGVMDNYTGISGMLLRKEADLCPDSLVMTPDRAEIMDFSSSINVIQYSLFYRSSAVKETMGWGTFAMEFHWTMWLAFIIFWQSSCLLHWLIKKVEISVHANQLRSRLTYRINDSELYYKMAQLSDPDHHHLQSLSDIMLTYFGWNVQQGAPTTPSSGLLRYIVVIFWMATKLLFAVYTANLTSLLMITNRRPFFQTVEEAVLNPSFEVGLLKGTGFGDLLTTFGSSWATILLKQLEEDPSLFMSDDQAAMERIVSSNYAFFGECFTMEYLVQSNCSVFQIPTRNALIFGRFGFAKNLPFTTKLNEMLNNLFTSGILVRIRNKYLFKSSSCFESSEFLELGFSHTLTAFLLLSIGILVSLFLIAAEKKTPRQRDLDIRRKKMLAKIEIRGIRSRDYHRH